MLYLSLPYQFLNNPLPLIQPRLVFESLNLQDLALHEVLGSCAGVTGKFFSRLRKGYVDQLEFADHRLSAVQANFFSRLRKGYVDWLEFADHRLSAVRWSDRPFVDGAGVTGKKNFVLEEHAPEGAPRCGGEAGAVQGRPTRLRRAAVGRRRRPRRLPHRVARHRWSGTYTCNL